MSGIRGIKTKTMFLNHIFIIVLVETFSSYLNPRLQQHHCKQHTQEKKHELSADLTGCKDAVSPMISNVFGGHENMQAGQQVPIIINNYFSIFNHNQLITWTLIL